MCVDGHSQTVVPTTVRTCVTSQSCSTSAWTEWTLDKNPECQGRERKVKRMVRNRQIIKLPTGDGGPCPHLAEYKPLMPEETNATCTPKYLTILCSPESLLKLFLFPIIRYTLVASAWSPCRVQDMNGNAAICGGGLQDRNISCLKSEGQKPVDLRLCSSLVQLTRVQRCVWRRATKPTFGGIIFNRKSCQSFSLSRCFLPCTDTCRVGPWSEWSECIPKDCSALQAPPHLPGMRFHCVHSTIVALVYQYIHIHAMATILRVGVHFLVHVPKPQQCSNSLFACGMSYGHMRRVERRNKGDLISIGSHYHFPLYRRPPDAGKETLAVFLFKLLSPSWRVTWLLN